MNEAILHAAFIPFGEIKDVSIPLDHASGKHRGFGFVEFEDKDDAADAIDNMHNAGAGGGRGAGGGALPPGAAKARGHLGSVLANYSPAQG